MQNILLFIMQEAFYLTYWKSCQNVLYAVFVYSRGVYKWNCERGHIFASTCETRPVKKKVPEACGCQKTSKELKMTTVL